MKISTDFFNYAHFINFLCLQFLFPIFSLIPLFLSQQKNPGTLRFRGILRLDTIYLSILYILLRYLQCTSNLHCSLLIVNYSMIVATRPEPTVLPPSRYQNGVLHRLNGYFSSILCEKMRIFHCVRVVFGNFVIMVLSVPLSVLPNNLHIIPYNL